MTEPQLPIERRYEQAVEALDSGRFDVASQLFLSVIAEDRNSPGAVRGLALCQEAQGCMDQAAASFDRAMMMPSCPPSILVEAAEFYKRTGDLPRAEATLRRALSAGSDPSWFQRLGSILLAAGKVSEGLDWMRRGLTLAPMDAQMRVNLAHALLRAGLAREAEASLKDGMLLSPNEPLLIGMAGLICAERKEWSIAVEFFGQALRLDASICWIRSARAHALRQLGQNVEARRDYEIVLERCPEDVEAARGLGEVLETLGAFADAVRVLERAHVLRPDDKNLLAATSYSLVQLGRPSEGIERARHGLSDDARSHLRLARTLGAADQLEEALEVCRRALALDPTDPEGLFLAGQLLSAKGLSREASDAFDRAAAIDPEPFLRNPNLRS